MKAKKAEVTNEDALRLIQAGGETNPSRERMERTRCLLQICEEMGTPFTHWNERLYPKLDDLLDCQLFTAAEKAFGVHIADSHYENAPVRTFGDLVAFYDEYVAFVLARRDYEKAKLAGANCATQTAFYTLRRRLCDAGVGYYQAHDLRPNAAVFDLSGDQAEKFTNDLHGDYGLMFVPDRVLWNRVRTDDVLVAFLLLSGCIGIGFALLPIGVMVWNAFLSAVTWIITGVAFGRMIDRHSKYRLYCLPQNYQTLGDVARKITAAAPPAAAQPAHS